LEQELAAEASAVFFLMSNLKEILKRLGNRGYRVAQIEGGIVAGRIYLMSYSLNLGATGLTFYDDEITEFFSPHAENKNNIIVVAVGKPAYRSKKGKFTYKPLIMMNI
jgi:Nitroreductase family.